MIPLVLSIVGTALPPLIRILESRFAPSTGADKKATAVAAVKAVLNAMSTAGLIQGVVGDDDIAGAVEAVVQVLKSQGELGGVRQTTVSPTMALPIGTYIVKVEAAK